jgi:hypothetical protein
MSYRFPTELVIGGPLSRDSFSLEWAGEPFRPAWQELLGAREEDGLLHLHDHERAAGDVEEVAGNLRELAIPYDHRTEGGYGLPPCASTFRPAADHLVHDHAEPGGEPVYRWSKLLGVRDLLRSHRPGAALALLEGPLGAEVPPLEPLRMLGQQNA